MEAVALYTFRATEGDELSFNKGDMLKVRSHLSLVSLKKVTLCVWVCFVFFFMSLQISFRFFTVSVAVKNFARTQNLQRTMTH